MPNRLLKVRSWSKNLLLLGIEILQSLEMTLALALASGVLNIDLGSIKHPQTGLDLSLVISHT